MWFLSLAFGNDGKWLHWIWVRTSEVSVLLPVFAMYLVYLVDASYGTREVVMMSWCGQKDCAALTAASADKNYLMWRNVAPISPSAIDFTFKSQLLYQGYDTNANRSYWLLLVSAILQITLWAVSFQAMIRKYSQESHSNYEEFSIHGPEESSG